MKDLSKSDEQKALTALETAIEHVGEGMTPNDALTKVAEENKLTAQMTQRMIEAYNVSKTLSHLKNADGEKRADSFAVADPNVILGKLFPTSPETEQTKAAAALHPDYLLGGAIGGDFMKAASVELPPLVTEAPKPYMRDPGAAAQRAFDGRNKLISFQKRAKAEAGRHYWEMLAHVDKAAAYWKQVGPTEDFALVEKRAVATYGPTGKALMDLIFEQGGLDDKRLHVKRAAAESLGQQQMMFDETQEPYSIIADAVKEAHEVARCSKEAAQLQRQVHSQAIDNVDFLPEGPVVEAIEYFDPPEIEPDMVAEKSAGTPFAERKKTPAKAKKMYNAMMHRPAEKKKMIERYGSKEDAERVAAATANKYGK